jgi:hypothetical protein
LISAAYAAKNRTHSLTFSHIIFPCAYLISPYTPKIPLSGDFL